MSDMWGATREGTRMMKQGLKEEIKSEKERVAHEAGGPESSGRRAAELNSLEMKEQAIDAMYGAMEGQTELQSKVLGGADAASVSAFDKMPGGGMLESGSSKAQGGAGTDLGVSLDLGGPGDASKTSSSGLDSRLSTGGQLTDAGSSASAADNTTNDRLPGHYAGTLGGGAGETELQRQTSLDNGGGAVGRTAVAEASLGVTSVRSDSLAPSDRAQIGEFIAKELGGDPSASAKPPSSSA